MNGEKIEKAKQAAIKAIGCLNANDIVSVVLYNDKAHVLVPATKASDKESIYRKIRGIQAGGSTALYAGVCKGGDEIRKFKDSKNVSRIILLSDGLANVGPQSSEELGCLGAKLIQEGVSVTTIGLGLGYNEDLMAKLAFKSDGSHYFVEHAEMLAEVFDKEFGRAMTVVAQEIQINIQCADGIRPVRLLGREGKIKGQKVSVYVNQLYSEHEKYVILEVEIPAARANTTRQLASVKVTYDNLKSHTTDKISRDLKLKFDSSQAKIDENINKEVMIDVVEQIANERNEVAVKMRDEGRIKESEQMLHDNISYLGSNASIYQSDKLEKYMMENKNDAENLRGANWNKQRKNMRYRQSAARSQD
jgi:Ca-activated chloride channel family protein